MKIKCNSCGLEADYDDYISFKNHCRDNHPRDSLREYARQVFKIHEKIESLLESKKMGHVLYFEEVETLMLQELKSLIESESNGTHENN